MVELEYSDNYKHFDGLIWQVPAWSSAIFLGTIGTASITIKNHTDTWKVGIETLLVVIFLTGSVFIFAASYALYRMRCHQKLVSPSHVVSGDALSTQDLLQFSISLEFSLLVSFVVYYAFNKPDQILIAVIAVSIIVTMMALYKCGVRNAQAKPKPSAK